LRADANATTFQIMAVTESGHVASREVDELYRRHGGEVYRYALAVLGNHADAEDVTQTTFLNAYRSMEQGVRPRKPSNWLLVIASNAIKQRFRQEQARPRQVELDERTAHLETDDVEGPTVGELLAALSKIPPQQRQAIVLREFEGRSYAEISEILGVTKSALEALLFRARRSLAEELDHQLTCTEAQLAISKLADGRLGRKERRRLRSHLAECPDCARFASLQQRNRRALKGLMLVPIPLLSLSLFKGMEGTATAATVPAVASAAAAGTSAGTVGATGGGIFAGGLVLKTAALVTAATMVGGAAVVGSSELHAKPPGKTPIQAKKPGLRLGQVAPRGVVVPGSGVARGKAKAPGQTKKLGARAHAQAANAHKPSTQGKSAAARSKETGRANRPTASTTRPAQTNPKSDTPTNAQRSQPKHSPNGRTTSAATDAPSSQPVQASGNADGLKAP
jgi:RNA polymerase sigma factor (sigma-70 family)